MFDFATITEASAMRVYIGRGPGKGDQEAALSCLETLRARGAKPQLTIVYESGMAVKVASLLGVDNLQRQQVIELNDPSLSPHPIDLMSLDYFLAHRDELPTVDYGMTGAQFGCRDHNPAHLFKTRVFVNFSPYLQSIKERKALRESTEVSSLQTDQPTVIPLTKASNPYHLVPPTVADVRDFYQSTKGQTFAVNYPLIHQLLASDPEQVYIMPIYGMHTNFQMEPAMIVGRLAEALTRFKREQPAAVPGKLVLVLLNQLSHKDISAIERTLAMAIAPDTNQSPDRTRGEFCLPKTRLLQRDQLTDVEALNDLGDDELLIINTGPLPRRLFNYLLSRCTAETTHSRLPRIPVFEGANSRKALLGYPGCGHHLNLYYSRELWPYVLQQLQAHGEHDLLATFKSAVLALSGEKHPHVGDDNRTMLATTEAIDTLIAHFTAMSQPDSAVRVAWRDIIIASYQATDDDRLAQGFAAAQQRLQPTEQQRQANYQRLQEAVASAKAKGYEDVTAIRALMEQFSPFDSPNIYDARPVILTIIANRQYALLQLACSLYPTANPWLTATEVEQINPIAGFSEGISLHSLLPRFSYAVWPEVSQAYQVLSGALRGEDVAAEKIAAAFPYAMFLRFSNVQLRQLEQAGNVAAVDAYTHYAVHGSTPLIDEKLPLLTTQEKVQVLYLAGVMPFAQGQALLEATISEARMGYRNEVRSAAHDLLLNALGNADPRVALALLDKNNQAAGFADLRFYVSINWQTITVAIEHRRLDALALMAQQSMQLEIDLLEPLIVADDIEVMRILLAASAKLEFYTSSSEYEFGRSEQESLIFAVKSAAMAELLQSLFSPPQMAAECKRAVTAADCETKHQRQLIDGTTVHQDLCNRRPHFCATTTRQLPVKSAAALLALGSGLFAAPQLSDEAATFKTTSSPLSYSPLLLWSLVAGMSAVSLILLMWLYQTAAQCDEMTNCELPSPQKKNR